MPRTATHIRGALELDEDLKKLTETLHHRGRSGKVVAIVTLSRKRISWYGSKWPSEEIIFGRLNSSIGVRGSRCNGFIHRYNDHAPQKFRNGVFVQASVFGLKDEEAWVALVNIDTTLGLDEDLVSF